MRVPPAQALHQEMRVRPRHTFCPTSSSRKKKPAPRSSSDTFSVSTTSNFPMPARTIFLMASVATPFNRNTSMAAFRILCRRARSCCYQHCANRGLCTESYCKSSGDDLYRFLMGGGGERHGMKQRKAKTIRDVLGGYCSPLLGLKTPKPDLSVVDRSLVYRTGRCAVQYQSGQRETTSGPNFDSWLAGNHLATYLL